MTINGKSQLGVLDGQTASRYIQQAIVLSKGISEQKLWQTAKAQLGPPEPTAGHPNVRLLNAATDPYLAGVLANPRFGQAISGVIGWSFAMVEIRPLLTVQLDVEFDRVAALNAATITDRDVLELCLPQTIGPPPISSETAVNNGVKLTGAQNLALIAGASGVDAATALKVYSVGFGERCNLAQVSAYGGRFHLKNATHRAYRLLEAGVDEMPALLVHAPNWQIAGLAGPGPVNPALLNGSNPPTMGRFVNGAIEVELRKFHAEGYVSAGVSLLPGPP